MESFYLLIIVFLLVLAVFDLFVGVSNDAVNFLQSAVGAKAARFRTILMFASLGVIIGAMMSAGMMDVARHGIMLPARFSYAEVMVVFLAVMVTDVIVLDMFNTLGLPTSTTVSLVFELLGGAFVMSLFKMHADPSLSLGMLLNSDKALSVIIAIFTSVAIAFVFGVVVQYITRVVFTFNYKSHLRYTIAIYGGVAFTCLAYFIFVKGLSKSPLMPAEITTWVEGNTPRLMLYIFLASAVASEVLHLLRVDVFRLVTLVGTFALAMAFAGNDLVNFIGVPLAGLSSFNDWMSHGHGDPSAYMMTSLMESAPSPFLYLIAAGVIMIVAMQTSKKAQNVVKTSVDLSRQDEGDEMFGSSRAARSIVRATQESGSFFARIVPQAVQRRLDRRFNKDEAILPDGAAFDMVRAANSLVLASLLIIIGTNYKLPLSTTYVTFMVAMGTSLADRAWSRESAVFRVTGVLSVIGGWFITAGAAFIACGAVVLIMQLLGPAAMIAFMLVVIYMLIRSNLKYKRRMAEEQKDDVFRIMMRTKDAGVVWQLLRKHVSRTQSAACRFVLTQYDNIIDGLDGDNLRTLRRARHALNEEQDQLKKTRKKEFLAMRRIPKETAIEKNTWFHLGSNSDRQFIYCLKRMLEPAIEHVDNHFNPMPAHYVAEYEPVRRDIDELMKRCEQMISTNRYDRYDETLATAEQCKNNLSRLRKHHLDRMQSADDAADYKISLVYLNILQESQELLSIMRHQLRAARKFLTEV